MTTFEYVDCPVHAIRLTSALKPATEIFTTLPDDDDERRPRTEPVSSPTTTTPALLSTRDPLSVPIMTANFRRFVSKVGPLFWLMDRIEEIVFWKKGWKRTTVYIAAYGFLCYFPRMTLLIPHIVLLSVMLSYYPDPGVSPVQISVGTADWQANIQAIQNLMGAISDLHDAVVPFLSWLAAPPSRTATQPHHPLLIVTLLSFLFFLPILMANLVPLRLLFFLTGAGVVGALHPRVRRLLSSTIFTAISGSGPGISFQLSIFIPRLLSLFSTTLHDSSPHTHTFAFTLTPRDSYLFFRRLVDDDRLDDTVWPAPLTHVELWENERWVQDTTEHKRRKSAVIFVREGREGEEEDDAASTTSTATLGDSPKPLGIWSKSNLKPTERVGWTRGRDGWCGVGGEVSNLTFSLSPGWTFVDTEGWRPDLRASWAVEGGVPRTSVCVGADQDGWAYTTDTWTHPRPDGRPSDGWVTRRRRWVRRVYFQGVAQEASR